MIGLTVAVINRIGGQQALVRRQRRIVAFMHLRAVALLARQLERWLEEVDVEPRWATRRFPAEPRAITSRFRA